MAEVGPQNDSDFWFKSSRRRRGANRGANLRGRLRTIRKSKHSLDSPQARRRRRS